jgi:hypothetical protein
LLPTGAAFRTDKKPIAGPSLHFRHFAFFILPFAFLPHGLPIPRRLRKLALPFPAAP